MDRIHRRTGGVFFILFYVNCELQFLSTKMNATDCIGLLKPFSAINNFLDLFFGHLNKLVPLFIPLVLKTLVYRVKTYNRKLATIFTGINHYRKCMGTVVLESLWGCTTDPELIKAIKLVRSSIQLDCIATLYESFLYVGPTFVK